MTVVLLRRGAARDATEFEDAHLVVVVAFLRLVGLVLFIFEDEDEAHAFAKEETAVAARNMVFLRRSLSLSLSLEEQLFVRATCPRERKNSAVLFLSLRKKCAKGEREPPREVKNTPQTQGQKIKAKKRSKNAFVRRRRERTEADTRER